MHGKNAWRVAHDVAAMIDDEPGPAGDFIKCYVTQWEKSQFFFNQSYLKRKLRRRRHQDVTISRKYMHLYILIVFMVQCFLSMSKDLAKMLMEKYVTFAPQEKSAVVRLNVSQGHFQITKPLDIITFSLLTPTNNRVVDDYLPRAQLKKAYISGECSLEDPTSISNFSRQFIVSEECVKIRERNKELPKHLLKQRRNTKIMIGMPCLMTVLLPNKQ